MKNRSIVLYIVLTVLGLAAWGFVTGTTIYNFWVEFYRISIGFEMDTEAITIGILSTVISIIEVGLLILILLRNGRNVNEKAILTVFAWFASTLVGVVVFLDIISAYAWGLLDDDGVIVYTIVISLLFIGTLAFSLFHTFYKKEIVGRKRAISIWSSAAVSALSVVAIALWWGFHGIPFWLY